MGSEAFEERERVVLRFAGDSGDGMQLAGSRFTSDTAFHGNDLRTLPDFPAEIRAPAGSLAGVSAFQISFASDAISTPGDDVDVLIAMNPAALRANLSLVRRGGIIIANTAQFTERNLKKVDYPQNPLEDGSLTEYRVHGVEISKLTQDALEELNLPTRTVERCKNCFALGLVLWMYDRELDRSAEWFRKKFATRPDLLEANLRALKAGYFFGETSEVFASRFRVKPAELPPGTYRNLTGNQALALGLITASTKSGLPLFQGSYPITPASDILHELAKHKAHGVHTFQAEDEIAAITAAIGAAYGGALAMTSTSGPGVALKSEAIGLATMIELPLVVVDVQRGGPSTGLPTKTEQADLLQALYGRNSEAPVPVLAAASPADCFDVAYEAARLALKYMTPVFLLSDGYLANGSEPWAIADPEALPNIDIAWWQDIETFEPYRRDPKTLARPRVRPGTKGLEHRVGGLEKEHRTGGVSYEPHNHEMMVRLRHEKVQRIAREIPPTEIHGPTEGSALVLSWGSTRGAVRSAVSALQNEGLSVAWTSLRFLNPLPSDLQDVMARYEHIVVPELNMGQLSLLIRGTTQQPVHPILKIQGQPFRERELIEKIRAIVAGDPTGPFTVETVEPILREANL